ncbi:MAG: rhomboid family intramembrane serine protease [Sphingobacteriaceae bacterium]
MNTLRQSPLNNLTPVVKNLLIINIIFYVFTFILKSAKIDLVELFAVFYFDSPFFKPWQIITHMFMHDPNGILHILFNMFALFSFGPTLETVMGSKRFFNFYFITGLGAMTLQMLVQGFEVHAIAGAFTIDPSTLLSMDPSNTQMLSDIYRSKMLGASGAIFGLLLAFGMLFPNAELAFIFIPVPIKAKYIIPGYILVELFLGVGQFSGDSIAHFAHIGGALCGFMLIKLWGLKGPERHY